MSEWAVVTLGEIMLRLSPSGAKRIVQAENFDVVYGGAEANVAVSLSCFGHSVRYVTRLPENALGDAVIQFLRRYEVDTQHTVRGGRRLGIYFMEPGHSLRPAQVIYDRRNSAMAEATPEDFNWDAIFKGAGLFHTCGITLAISPSAKEVAVRAAGEARRRGIPVSFDFNYRKELWTVSEAREAMEVFLPYVNVLFAGVRDAVEIMGFPSPTSADPQGQIQETMTPLLVQYNIEQVSSTLRKEESATRHHLSGYTLDHRGQLHMNKGHTFDIVDRIGGGDAFAAGFLHGWLKGWEPDQSLAFALAASVYKHTIAGDANICSEEEVQSMISGEGGFSIRR
ncbi:2-dehydro-3-deoxygluconokinase [Melghirimyces profundicolus]|uniref:2-dehydro-3-deoxygluconokinase n=1 Tax=Melghirimyces profundicolus TaxID=1242148 RepID=A0A2T6BD63_9BACL|nr:sugar kinase [Melghirimyces profundicolus]PTX53984.1 2-dehydro-3-deoxygluconokinase [Melghirimyces profundicolus]